METNLKKSMWGDAAKSGLIIGAAMLVFEGIKLFMGMRSLGWTGVVSLLELLVLATLIYTSAKKRGEKYGEAGFTYGQSMGFIIVSMLFAGIIYGVGTYVYQNFVAPDYYREVYELTFEGVIPYLGEDVAEESLDSLQRLMRNPIFMVFSGIISMVIYGGLIGLFASIFVKRRPDVFAGNNQF